MSFSIPVLQDTITGTLDNQKTQVGFPDPFATYAGRGLTFGQDALTVELSKGWHPEFFAGISAALQSIVNSGSEAGIAMVNGFIENAKMLQPKPLTYADKDKIKDIASTLPISVPFKGSFTNDVPNRRLTWTLKTTEGYGISFEIAPWMEYPLEGGGAGYLRLRDWDELVNSGPLTVVFFGSGMVPFLSNGKLVAIMDVSEETPLWPSGDDRIVQEGYQIEVGGFRGVPK